MATPTILVTNDDGIHANGLRALVEEMKELGELVVVAPKYPQSSTGHAITVSSPLRLEKVEVFGDIDAYQCSGTPVDSVKLAVDQVLHRKPDICVSGINHGTNSSINVLYSGTMSAAMEAAIEGVDAIGFSHLDPDHKADLSQPRQYARQITGEVIEKGLPDDTVLNVNFPKSKDGKYKGVRICRQAVAKWEENFEKRQDPSQHDYYWLSGEFVNYDNGDDTDLWALDHQYVSVVPVLFDLTAHHAITFLNEKWSL